MTVKKALSVLSALGIMTCLASSALAVPLITNVVEIGTMRLAPVATDPPVAATLDAAAPVVSSDSAPGPGQAPTDGLRDERFQFSDRTHEFTRPRTNTAGLLNTSAAGALAHFPYYLEGLEYIQTSNDNRDIIDYRLDVTLSAPVTAFLMIDNRANGDTSTSSGANTDDPTLTGNLAWVVSDGWTRVNSSQMPNGQADYLGSDEGMTLASNLPADRVHNGTGNEIGSGLGLNQFYAIYRKNFAAGTHVGFTKQNGIQAGSTYTVAVRPTFGAIVPGDVNQNGVADINDYNLIRTNFQLSGRTRIQGDLSGDGNVNFIDFRRWKNAVGPGVGAGLEAELLALIPEPGSMILAMFGALSVFAATGRRRAR